MIDMFALVLINNIDEYIGGFYQKHEVQSNEEGHLITKHDDFMLFDFTVFDNEIAYYWFKIFQLIWLIILFFSYGVKVIPGVTFNDPSFIYGYQPGLDLLLFFQQEQFYKSIGLATLADLWVSVCPISLFLVHYILFAKHQAYDKIEIEEMEMLQQDKR